VKNSPVRQFRDFWLRQRIRIAYFKTKEMFTESKYVKLDHFSKLLSELPFKSIDANIAATQHIWVMNTDFNSLISMLQGVNLKLETGGNLTPNMCSAEMINRTLDSLFIANKNYIPFDRIEVFIDECKKLVKLTHGIRTAKSGQDEYHFRILSNMFYTCASIHDALIENLRYGRLGS
jgi:hypothetical protein